MKTESAFTNMLRNGGLPVLGHINAGFPSPEEALRDIMSFDKYLITRPESFFIVKVTGDSMINAGIMPEDLVIVEKGRNPKSGDIVIAEVDGDWTMKYLRKEGKSIVLEAANPAYAPIRPKRILRLWGIVTAVVRKYHL